MERQDARDIGSDEESMMDAIELIDTIDSGSFDSGSFDSESSMDSDEELANATMREADSIMQQIDLSLDETMGGVSRRLEFTEVDGFIGNGYMSDESIDILGETKEDEPSLFESKEMGVTRSS
jgi:hypothetical protein